MGTVVNGNVWAGACVNGNVVSGIVKNGVVFYKKDTTPSVLYKRRIMVGDNLNSKVLYITLPPDFVVDRSTSIVETDMLNEIIKTKQSGDTGTPNVDLVYISDFIFVGLIGKTQYNMQSDFGTVTDIVDTDDAYRHLYIEDPNIRPIQVGDKLVDGTKLYFNFPDDFSNQLSENEIYQILDPLGDIIIVMTKDIVQTQFVDVDFIYSTNEYIGFINKSFTVVPSISPLTVDTIEGLFFGRYVLVDITTLGV